MADEVTLEVPGALDGERLDKALATLLGVSRAQARSLLDEGVMVDGGQSRPADRVRGGSLITSPAPAKSPGLEPEPVDFDVLHQDDSVLVVDKPAGVVVHPGPGLEKGTLAAGLLYRYPGLAGVGQPDRWGLIHRLDRETSGALVVARTSSSYAALVDMMRAREIKRVYTTLAQGLFGAATGTIDAPVGRDPVKPIRRAVVQGGKQARTHYEVIEGFPPWECTLLEVTLETGRTHQIRVHLAAIDHPVIGDRIYGKKASRVESPRVFLHAARVEFRHPTSGKTIEAESPLPAELGSVIASLVPDPPPADALE